jgi:hypothetical protein
MAASLPRVMVNITNGYKWKSEKAYKLEVFD